MTNPEQRTIEGTHYRSGKAISRGSPKKHHRFAVFESLQVGNLTKPPVERPDFQWSKENLATICQG